MGDNKSSTSYIENGDRRMIGIDMEKISRFEHWTDEGYQRIFTDDEIAYAKSFVNYLERFCGFYCVKEAFVKALDDNSINFKSIEILHNESGKPYINRTPFINSIMREKHAQLLDVSISHTKDYAIAVVQIQ